MTRKEQGILWTTRASFSHMTSTARSRLNTFSRNETYAIVGAALDVYHRLGIGFAEPVYQEALEIEFDLRGIPFEREKWLQISYKGRQLTKQYKADFMCFGQIIVEFKAQTVLTAIDWSQVINYLKASNLRIGLLFNFGYSKFLEKKRLIV